jgi:transposase
MLSELTGQKVFLARGTTDLRKSIDGLAAIVQLEFNLSPFDPCLFVFCNRCRDKVKILQWESSGFWLHYRRLEKGRFQWPDVATDKEPVSITWRELRWLLDGLPLKPACFHPAVNVKHVI